MDNRNINDVNSNIGPSSETVAGATGGAGGAVAGAALGSLAGPIGTIIGGLAGAVGGWWAGKAVADSPTFNDEDDAFYRSHHTSRYASNTADLADTARPSYNDVRPAYQLGHLAGLNPDYSNRSFDDIEPQLSSAYDNAYGSTSSRTGASGALGTNPTNTEPSGASQTNWSNSWSGVRQYAQDAYSRGREVGTQRFGTTADRTSFDSSNVGSTGSTLGDYGRDLRAGAANVGDRVADAADDLKDRVDGNPASRPGRDETDRPGR